MVYVIVLSLMAGALGVYYFIFKNLNYFKKREIPHLAPLPILGNMASIFFRRESIADFTKRIYEIHPDARYIGMYDLSKPIVMIRDIELIKSIAVKNFESFRDHRNFIDETQDLLGKNLFFLSGDRWREMRTMLSPAFTSSKMKSMFRLMWDYAIDFTNFLAQVPPERRTMDMKDIFTRYTNDVIATCAFGVSIDSMRDPKNQFFVYGKEATFFNLTAFLKMYMFQNLPWLARMLGLRIIREDIVHFFRDLVVTTIKAREENNIVRPDMMQLMIETKKEGKKELTIDDMTGQAFSFFFGGFDSTSQLMCFTAHQIAVYPEIQERLQNDIDQILEDTNGLVPYETINGMEYMDAVIDETLRMYPLAAALDRLCERDFELPPTLSGTKPHTIRKGQGLWVPVYALHYDSKYFADPERFDPERFLGERRRETLNCGAYLPFGLGPRMCIGNRFVILETKVLLFHLLARCNLKPCEKTPMPLKIAKDGFNVKPEGGFWLQVVPRKNTHRTVATAVVDGMREL